MPAYEKYGIKVELVERVKAKMKNPATAERVRAAIGKVTKSDLQNRATVVRLIGAAAKALGEKLSDKEKETLVKFVLERKIDPDNPLHLMKLWNMFR